MRGDLDKRLLAAAAASGRSVSEEIEFRLIQSFDRDTMEAARRAIEEFYGEFAGRRPPLSEVEARIPQLFAELKDARLGREEMAELKETIVSAFRQTANDDEKFRSMLSGHGFRMSDLIAVLAETKDVIQRSGKQIAKLEDTLALQIRAKRAGNASIPLERPNLRPNENDETSNSEGEKK